MSSTKFNSLRIEGWRQFGRVDISFHPRLTILTGANGAGKSSLLRILTEHFGFSKPFLATPIWQSDGRYTYITGLFTGVIARLWKIISAQSSNISNVGVIKYANGVESELQVPTQSAVQYNVKILKRQPVVGIHIDSHEPALHFQQVGQIPTNIITPEMAYNNYNNEVVHKYQGSHTGYSPTYRMKEAIIAMAMFGEGNTHVQGNAEVLKAYQSFVDALRTMLPESLGFLDIAVRPPEVVFVTTSGEFLIDAASGGVMAIIDLTWRLHMFSLMNDQFVVTIDEPENHLHPTMQRSLMRHLLTAFPKAQFIIATHSPIIVSSVRESNVFVLKYVSTETGEVDSGEQVLSSETSRVRSMKLDTINKAGNASAILREVLGVNATIPEWVEEELANVVARYREKDISQDVLTEFRRELSQIGCEELYPNALAALTEGQ